MEDIYRFEFTTRELSLLMAGIITAQVEDEEFVKNYPENAELVASLKETIKEWEALRVKLRKGYE